MVYIAWTEALETGIASIDRQHRIIVELVNDLHELKLGGSSREIVERVLHELVEYTLTHFFFEEELQQRMGYPFSKAHKRLHEFFARRLLALRGRFAAGEDVANEAVVLLEKWLKNHVSADDMHFAPMGRVFGRKDAFWE